MNRRVITIVPMLALAIVGCGVEVDDSGALLVTDTVEQASATAWTPIAPGVWERALPEGGFERMGFGAKGLAFALEAAQSEVSERSDAQSERAVAGAAHIKYLEASLIKAHQVEAELRKNGSNEELPPLTLTGPSGQLCGGGYNFDITLIPGIAGGGVNVTAEWSEFGPFLPVTKELITHARAEMNDGSGILEDVWDTTGPFGATCCAMSQSSAATGPTFTPKLLGQAFITVQNGCYANLYYEQRNY